MDQADLMVKLQVQLDVQSVGIDGTLRRRNHAILIEAYLHFPPRRVWLYLKLLRLRMFPDFMFNFEEGVSETFDPEDVIAKGIPPPPPPRPPPTAAILACQV